MDLDVKIAFYTTVSYGEQNQLFVWLTRMGELISALNISNQTTICVLVDGLVALPSLPKLPCTVHLCNIYERECYENDDIRLAALNEALSPIAKVAIFMALNVLPVKSLNPFLKPLKSSTFEQIALYPSRIQIDDIKIEMHEEYFRRLSISKNYFSSDLLALNVDKISRKLASSRTFNLLNRKKQIKVKDTNVVDDIINKLIPADFNFRMSEVFTLYPLLNHQYDEKEILEIRQNIENVKGAIVFDLDNLPWGPINNTATENIYPFHLYADAMLQTAERVSPEFAKSVLKKAFINTKAAKRYPAAICQAIRDDFSAEQLYQIICQLQRDGDFNESSYCK